MSFSRCIACFFLLVGPTAVQAKLPLLTPAVNGGTFLPDNFATQPGATAFAFDELANGSFAIHQTENLNDGIYGNSNSWIGEQTPTFAGISLAQSITLTGFAFGRDNLGFLLDRVTAGVVEVTSEVSPNAGTADNLWTAIGFVDGTAYASPSFRHFFTLDTPVINVTGIRFSGLIGGIGSGMAIDEIEVYGTPSNIPEPMTTAVLAGMAALGLATWRRRK